MMQKYQNNIKKRYNYVIQVTNKYILYISVFKITEMLYNLIVDFRGDQL